VTSWIQSPGHDPVARQTIDSLTVRWEKIGFQDKKQLNSREYKGRWTGTTAKTKVRLQFA